MNAPNLYDLAPLAPLLLAAAALTCVVVLAWWWRHGASDPLQRSRALTLLTLFLTFDLVLAGAFTRLTDSGLGCPDWPGCYGSASPLGAQGHIEQAQAEMPTGPVTHFKAWVEMLHRYLAMAVGGLLVLQSVLAWQRWWLGRRAPSTLRAISPWWSSAALAWVCVQGAFGAWTVTMKLFPLIVSLHLLGAYGLLALLVVQFALQGAAARRSFRTAPTALGRLAALALVVVVVQAMLGAWVSTNYAVLACTEVPMCQGQWWPPMDFSNGFALWRPLGSTAQGDILTFQALTAIHFVHRLFAMVACVVLLLLLYRMRQQQQQQLQQRLQLPARWLGALLLAQLATGVSNVVLDWPLLAALLHTAGAGALIGLLTWIWLQCACADGLPEAHANRANGARGTGGASGVGGTGCTTETRV